MSFPRVAGLKSLTFLRERFKALGLQIPVDETLDGSAGALGSTYELDGRTIGNRFCILPMEGWDGTLDGRPTDLTRRRWQNFAESGAKLLWGCEAVAVCHDGRANPRQLQLSDETLGDFADLRRLVIQTHRERFGTADDLCVGLQLTHSGRFAKPNPGGRPEPRIAYRHPILDRRVGVVDDRAVLSDAELESLIGDFARAAKRSAELGFDFVDIKHCHGYLGHELLSAVDRPGPFGGSLENRARFLTEIVRAIRSDIPSLGIAVRLSAFDTIPFRQGPDGVGIPEHWVSGRYPYAFGGDGTGLGIDLAEPIRLLKRMGDLGIRLVCVTGGSPYYNPHLQRPALFPPSDGYGPPEDPLVGVSRHLQVARTLKERFPQLAIVGTGYTYLQEWLAQVGQAVLRTGGADFVGLGRMVLSYPQLPADALARRPLERKRVCRTLSDCTTAPRNGLVSGCYPLDPFYQEREEHQQLLQAKRKS